MLKITKQLTLAFLLAITFSTSSVLMAEDDEAMRDFAIFTATKAFNKEAEEYLKEKEYAKAAKCYRKIEKIQENDTDKAHYLYLAAQNFLLGKKAHSARECYTKLLEDYICHVPLQDILEQLRELADAYERGDGTTFNLKDPAAAIEIYTMIIKYENSIRQSLGDRLTLAAKLESDHRPEEAVNAYQEIIKQLPDDPDTRFCLARLLDKMAAGGDSDGLLSKAAIREAKRFLTLAKEIDPRRSEAERIIKTAREHEGKRLLERANFYLNKYHRKPEVARRYLLDIRRDYSDTSAEEAAEKLLEENFPEEK